MNIFLRASDSIYILTDGMWAVPDHLDVTNVTLMLVGVVQTMSAVAQTPAARTTRFSYATITHWNSTWSDIMPHLVWTHSILFVESRFAELAALTTCYPPIRAVHATRALSLLVTLWWMHCNSQSTFITSHLYTCFIWVPRAKHKFGMGTSRFSRKSGVSFCGTRKTTLATSIAVHFSSSSRGFY